MSIVAEKTALRATALARRSAMPIEIRRAFGVRLAQAGAERVRLCGGDSVVSVYHPIRDEADTALLLATLADAGHATALPVTSGRAHPLRFHLWRPGDPVAPGLWSIPEPLDTAPIVDPDILFVPLAAFDRRGHRLGYGAGFYDTAIERLRRRKPVLAIGVAFAAQEVDAVPIEPHDQRLDAVITERETILFGPV